MNIGLFTQTCGKEDLLPSMYERIAQAAREQGIDATILTYRSDSDKEYIVQIDGYKKLLEICKKQDFNYLYSHNSYFPHSTIPLLSRLTNTNLIYAPHCTGIHKLQKSWKNRIKRLYTYPFFKDSFIRCISRWEYNRYKKMGFEEDKLFHIPYGINYELFSQIKPNFEATATFSIANARAFKNIETQIRAVDILKDEIEDYHHHLIGGWGDGGEYRDRIERMIAERGLENVVTIHGFVSRQDMLDIMSGCQAFLHTSHFETEGLVLYEAASAGFPVCTSDNPVHNQNFERFVHQDSDHRKLAEDIKTVFDLPTKEKEQISAEMRELGERFSYQKEKEQLDQLFGELAS